MIVGPDIGDMVEAFDGKESWVPTRPFGTAVLPISYSSEIETGCDIYADFFKTMEFVRSDETCGNILIS